MTIDCQHGQLARSCPMCEYESMIATLEQENRQMRARMELLENDAARYQKLRGMHWSDDCLSLPTPTLSNSATTAHQAKDSTQQSTPQWRKGNEMPKKMCEVCGEKPATVPDRERMGRLINRVCSSCHALRLKGDIKKILELEAKRRAKGE